MGRRKIDIEEIVDTKKRIVTFSKRRTGLERKLAQLCKLCKDTVVCLIVFSPAGRAYTYSNSPLDVCDVVERFVEEQSKGKNVRRSKNSTQCRDKTGVDDSYWWDNIDMEKLDSVEKLKAMRETLANLKQNLMTRKEKLTASSPLSSSSSTIDDMTAITEEHQTRETSSEAHPTTIGEKHETRKTSSNAHPKLDLNLYLGWHFNEETTTSLLEDKEEFPLLKRGQSHTLTELALF
ncbi:hypothetical protein MKW94_001021 [Papaver nudicaule]|uniref:MADS-box domain-containing protein n=1 Tax=Papaver nudicaule TaxID=74823 RepID=A0AA41VLF9_PAPNU|nr:hypothetical protein [Papaver nudicaule]